MTDMTMMMMMMMKKDKRTNEFGMHWKTMDVTGIHALDVTVVIPHQRLWEVRITMSL